MAFEAYKVAVRLTLVESVTAGLLSLSRHFQTTNRNAQELQRSIGQIQKLMLAGGAMVGVGMFGLKALQAPLDEAKKFQTEFAKFSVYGLGDKVNAEAAKFAKGMNVIGSSATENMKLLTEAQGVFREGGLSGSAALEGAKLAAPVLAKIAFATSSMDGESQAKYRTSSMDMLRFIEMRGGLKDAQTFNRIADEGWKAMRSSGGNVNWSQYRQFMARGGVAAQGLSDEALFGKLEPVIGEMKGSTAGFSLRTAFNRLNGIIRIPNQVAHELASSGVWDARKIVWNSQGGIKSFKGNPLNQQDMFSKDPVQFYESVIKPMYQKLGLTSVNQIARENAMIFGSTGGAMFSLIDRQLPAIHRSVEAQRKTLGIDASVGAAGGALGGKEIDLHAKWANLMLELGDKILPLAISGITALIKTVETLTAFTKAYPNLTKVILQGAAIFSVLSIVAGGVLLFSGAVKALQVALAFTALGPAITAVGTGILFLGRALMLNPIGLVVTAIAGAVYLLWRNWDAIGPKLASAWAKMKSDVMSLVGWLSTQFDRLAKLLPDWMVPERGRDRPNGSPHLPPAGSKSPVPMGNVYLDGKKVGQHVAGYLGHQIGQSTNTGNIDHSVALPMPGLK